MVVVVVCPAEQPLPRIPTARRQYGLIYADELFRLFVLLALAKFLHTRPVNASLCSHVNRQSRRSCHRLGLNLMGGGIRGSTRRRTHDIGPVTMRLLSRLSDLPFDEPTRAAKSPDRAAADPTLKTIGPIRPGPRARAESEVKELSLKAFLV